VTDEGILTWLSQQQHARLPSRRTIDAVKRRFVSLLQQELARSPDRFRAVPGAQRMLEVLDVRGWTMAAATGGWRRPAELKLEAAGLSPRLLMASSDDSADRTQVFTTAAKRAACEADRRDVVLIGDGVWDVQVAGRLGWRFIGIGSAEKAVRLRQAGARTVLPDLSDVAAFEAAALDGSLVVGAPRHAG
jgi:phosphoglycolate phosphatase-like HAD superfamily hydrolase